MTDNIAVGRTLTGAKSSAGTGLRAATIVAASLGLVLALPNFTSDYVLTLAVEVMIAGIFASGLNLLIGYTGLVSAGQAMFLGLGGYGVGIGSVVYGLPLWVSVPACLVVVALVSAVVGLICTRTRGVEFLLITLAFSQMFYGAAIKLRLTNGADGMAGVPRPSLPYFGLSADNPIVFYYYVALVAAASLCVLALVIRSPFGSILVGIRENERRLIAMGYAVTRYKIGAFVISAMVCAVAGILQAQYTYFINPDSMTWQASGEGILMVIIGGANAVFGPFLGAAIFVLVKQVLSFITSEYHLFFGVFFMLVVVFFRGGVTGVLRSLREKRQ